MTTSMSKLETIREPASQMTTSIRNVEKQQQQQNQQHQQQQQQLAKEVLILETKAGHDGLYDEMLDISKQLLSMNIINHEQLDNFVFNYGK